MPEIESMKKSAIDSDIIEDRDELDETTEDENEDENEDALFAGPFSSFRFRLRWLLYLAGIIVLVAVVAGGLWWYNNSTLKPAADSPEVNFARDMSAHHAQAVDMATKIHDRTTDPALKTFSLDIMLTQQAQIGIMQGWLYAWQYPQASTRPLMGGQNPQSMGMATTAQVYALDTLPLDQAEISFLQLMIRHHQGGIMMAQQVLNTTTQPAVVQLATSIVKSQQSEISSMQELLKERGVSS